MKKEYTLNPQNKWHQIVKAQFDDIKEKGAIEKNSVRLWKPPLNQIDPTTEFTGLHRWTNEDWKDCLAEAVQDERGIKVIQGDSNFWQTIENALLAMKRAEDLGLKESKRILDTKIYKPTQWKLMMLLRELYMNINRLTVDDIIAEGKDEEYQKENQYGKLFE